jgi:hypothetical protein
MWKVVRFIRLMHTREWPSSYDWDWALPCLILNQYKNKIPKAINTITNYRKPISATYTRTKTCHKHRGICCLLSLVKPCNGCICTQLWFPVCGTTKYITQRKATIFFCKLKKIMFSILGTFTVVKFKIIL